MCVSLKTPHLLERHTHRRILRRIEHPIHDRAGPLRISGVVEISELLLEDISRRAPRVGVAGLRVRLPEEGDAARQGQQQTDGPLLPGVLVRGVGEDGLGLGAGHLGGGWIARAGSDGKGQLLVFGEHRVMKSGLKS
ncbi:hypothetical protein PG996_004675 [Apiospora saccharicola]|uniref:Uncharacterized protein n=1 Tax=Apiospora saccharicola TaxID=335842 RepID=A0ABR1W4S1_9PEZI